jgi:hypothetical protein
MKNAKNPREAVVCFGIPHGFIEIPFYEISMTVCKDCKHYHALYTRDFSRRRDFHSATGVSEKSNLSDIYISYRK